MLNKEFGGDLVRDSSLKFAESYCVQSKSRQKCMAAWIRAVIVDHPFTDGNKRTAYLIVALFKMIHNQKGVARALSRIAKNNITDLDKIVEVINNANRK